MERWDELEEQTIFDMTIKAYRDPYEALNTFKVPFVNVELDGYSFEYLGSELFMYRILDINFEEYIEERGDLDRIKNIYVPMNKDETRTIY